MGKQYISNSKQATRNTNRGLNALSTGTKVDYVHEGFINLCVHEFCLSYPCDMKRI